MAKDQIRNGRLEGNRSEDCELYLASMNADREIAECDINPLIVHVDGKGCSVADSRIMLRRVK